MKDWNELMSEIEEEIKETNLEFTLKFDYYFGRKYMAVFHSDVEEYVNGVSETSFKEAANNALLNLLASYEPPKID